MIKIFNNLSNLQQGLLVAILAVVLYVGSTTIAYSLFSKSPAVFRSGGSNAELPGAAKAGGEDPSLPKNEECPLDGQMHTKPAKEQWEKRSPLAVMIENHEESRPQSGLSSADIVYEAVAEGGITRFMAIFYCEFDEVQVGPVRSARTYFLDWISEYPLALYAHVGGANTPGPANALGQIIDYGTRSLNQFGIGFPTYWRDYQRLGRPVATEHTMYSTTKKLWDAGAKRGWSATDSGTITGRTKTVATGKSWSESYVAWKFKDDAKDKGNTGRITVTFWESQPNYKVEWNYDSNCNCYKRNNGGQAHNDLNVNQQLSPKNVVIRYLKEGRANDGYEGNVHLIYGNKGQGKGVLLQDGKVTEITWVKANRLAREKFLDKSGKEIQFNRGQIWLEAVPEGSTVSY